MMATIPDEPLAVNLPSAIPKLPGQGISAPIQFGRGVIFRSVSEAFALASEMAKQKVGPKDATGAGLCAAMLKGQSLGLDPMTSIWNITTTNGRGSIMGDLALGLVRRSGLLKDFKREWVGTPGNDDYGCVISGRREEEPETSYSFTVGEARTAGLIRGDAPDYTKLAEGAVKGVPVWYAHVKRMLYYRALGFFLRDTFSDVLMGIYLTEELGDPIDTDPSPASHFVEPAPEGPDPLLAVVEETPLEPLAVVEVPEDAPSARPALPAAVQEAEAPFRPASLPEETTEMGKDGRLF
jgi:hypothetical protein